MNKPMHLRLITGPYSYDAYPSDGLQVDYIFSFVGPDKGYMTTNDIYVEYRNSKPTLEDGSPNPDYGKWSPYNGSVTFTGTNSLTLSFPIEATVDGSDNVRIRRIMDKEYPVDDYRSDQIFQSRNLNSAFLHALYINHELLDGFIDTRFAIGPQGPQGPVGPMGPEGKEGPRGPQGIQGVRGPQGVVGPQGPDGVKGEQGTQGPRGPQGVEGPQGEQGVKGETGDQGPAGLRGLQGPLGPVGPQGPIGLVGPAGPQGLQGPLGPKGPQGETGTIGERGPQGPMGPAGAAGPQGTQGPKGEFINMRAKLTPAELNAIPLDSHNIGDGYQMASAGSLVAGTQTIAVAADDIVTWVLGGLWLNIGPIRGPQGPQGPVGPRGEQGPTGQQGPRGDKGEQGEQGLVGPRGPEGPQGRTGDQGPAGPVGNQGPAGVVGPQGLPGERGPVGPTGPQGPQGITGMTGPQGFEGPVGPRGQQGPQGLPGITGPEGDQGPIGPRGEQGIPGQQGPVGPQGPMGPQGPSGNQGPQGPIGFTGVRGSRSFNQVITGTSWVGLNAQQVYSAQGYATVEPYDISIQYNPTKGFTEARYFNGTTAISSSLPSSFDSSKWTVMSRVEGNVIKYLDGVSAEKLTIGSVTQAYKKNITIPNIGGFGPSVQSQAFTFSGNNVTTVGLRGIFTARLKYPATAANCYLLVSLHAEGDELNTIATSRHYMGYGGSSQTMTNADSISWSLDAFVNGPFSGIWVLKFTVMTANGTQPTMYPTAMSSVVQVKETRA